MIVLNNSRVSVRSIVCVMCLLLLLVTNALYAQNITPFHCDGRNIITIAVNNNQDSQLHYLNQNGTLVSVDPLLPAMDVVVNSLGYNPVDNFLYATVSFGGSVNGVQYSKGDIIRIGLAGQTENLGNPGWANEFYWIGAFLADGTYVVANDVNGTSKIFTIDVSTTPARIITQSTTPGIAFNDIAVNPLDFGVYTIDENIGTVVEINPYTGQIINTLPRQTGIGIGVNAGSQFFSAEGRFFAYDGTGAGKMYEINMNPSSSTYGVGTIIGIGPITPNHDGASCIDNLSFFKTVNKAETFPGDTLTYTYEISNSKLSSITIDFEDALPEDASNRSFVAGTFRDLNGVGGVINNYAGTRLLSLKGLTIPARATINLRVDVLVGASSPSGIYLNQATICNLPSGGPDCISSDDPTVAGNEDPTIVRVIAPECVMDSCGVCGGDGSSCCTEIDQSDLQSDVDNRGYGLSTIITKLSSILRSVAKKSTTTSLKKKLRNDAKDGKKDGEIVANNTWIAIWTFDSTPLSCNVIDNSCTTVFAVAQEQAYLNEFGKLNTIMKKLYKKIKRNGKKINATKELRKAKKLRTRFLKEEQETLDAFATLIKQSDVCS